ncbi:MAG: class I SAM-dependent methyltransferase [Methanotrichaceae archaeon]|jgi:ubiquinone/menaquinone biosynthesis C-methylase UbiE
MMAEKAEIRHEHHGMSSKGFLDAGEVLRYIGINEGDRFLDLGCGDGHLSIAASQVVGKDGLVYAFDVDEESIAQLQRDIAEKKITNIKACVVDITKKLPLEDESISLAFMSNVLHGLVENSEADSTLNEIARVTQYNGKMAVVEFKKLESPMGPPLSIRLSPEDVETLARGYGFSKESAQEVGPHHYAIILRKRWVTTAQSHN